MMTSDVTSQRDPNRSAMWARILLDELVAAGLRDVCISPGSRSTPLTLAAASHPALSVHSHIDERSAAFFALGCAKRHGRLVALICTSGSAAGHYLPAFIEAFYARIPLIALTADRPVELIDTGAPQTIQQQHLFGPHVVGYTHLERPDVTPQALRRLRVTVQRMAACALGRVGSEGSRPGPVHVNVPFAEPLEPTLTPDDPPASLWVTHPPEVLGRADGRPWIEHTRGPLEVERALVDELSERMAAAQRGVLVCGPYEVIHEGEGLGEALVELAARSGFVLLPDVVSGARMTAGDAAVITAYDAILRAKRWGGAARPDLIVRVGAQPTSKSYRLWREGHAAVEEIVVDPFGQVLDHPQLSSRVMCAAPVALARAVSQRLEGRAVERSSAWRAYWLRAQHFAQAELISAAADDAVALWEGRIARDVGRALGRGDVLWLASSMPIRDADAFLLERDGGPLVLSNRGANGIDGLVASAAGAAAARLPGRVVLLIGDVAFLHDASSLLAAVRGPDPRGERIRLDIVVVNNDGGGIFSYLPIAEHREHFERHFLTTHTVSFEALCGAYGVAYERAQTVGEWREVVGSLGRGEGVRVYEAVVDREHNVSHHRELWQRVARGLDELMMTESERDL